MDAQRLTTADLGTLFLFESLEPDQLEWLAEHGVVEDHRAGSTICVEGEPASCFYVLLEGTIALSRRVDQADVEVNRSSQRGAYTGATRAWLVNDAESTYFQGVRAVTDCRMYALPADELGGRMREWFPMAVHMLEGLFRGMSSTQALLGQRERLAALGRMTAGLTHELNNPAAAAVRATSTLRERVAAMRHKLGQLAGARIEPEALVALAAVQEEAIERAAKAAEPSALEASDREDAIGDWLEDHDVRDAWQLAPVIVAAGLDEAWLTGAAARIPADLLENGLRWIAYALETEQLMAEIEDATTRVSSLVAAAKQYSQMDRAEHQLLDVHEGLKSTLVMLGRKIGDGIELVKDFDRTLPRVPMYAGELNQVWTNLLDNALAAMDGSGTLTVRTRRDGDDAVVVEICDTGPGIPEPLQQKIFEPFFTTKPVGEGTGLGLDISWRIVTQRHGGDLTVTSVPGDTRFTVRLPLDPPA